MSVDCIDHVCRFTDISVMSVDCIDAGNHARLPSPFQKNEVGGHLAEVRDS